MLYMLIDVTEEPQTKIILCADIHTVQLWGQYYKLSGRKVIAPAIEGKGFSKLDQLALQYLVWNTFQEAPREEYKDLVLQAKELVDKMEPDTTPLKDLEKMVDALRPLDDDGNEIKPGRKKSSGPKEPRDPLARPKPGTSTGMVWDLCDELMAKLGSMPERKAAIEFCMEEGGIHKATASTQFAKWKKAASKNIAKTS